MENGEIPEDANESNEIPVLFVRLLRRWWIIYLISSVLFCIIFWLMLSLWGVFGFQIAQVLNRSRQGNQTLAKDVPTNQFVLLLLKALIQVLFRLHKPYESVFEFGLVFGE